MTYVRKEGGGVRAVWGGQQRSAWARKAPRAALKSSSSSMPPSNSSVSARQQAVIPSLPVGPIPPFLSRSCRNMTHSSGPTLFSCRTLSIHGTRSSTCRPTQPGRKQVRELQSVSMIPDLPAPLPLDREPTLNFVQQARVPATLAPCCTHAG